MNDLSKTDWQEYLALACVYSGESSQEEQTHYLNAAKQAPLEELQMFLNKPVGKFQESGRAAMSIVLENRLEEISEAQAKKQWWRGLTQQVGAKIIGSLLLALIFTGVWFC